MSDASGTTPPAGYYPDPAGGPGRRWWDGRQWTDRVEQPYTGAAVEQPQLPPGTGTNTPWVWVMVLLPLLSVLAVSLFDWRGYLEASLQSSLSRDPMSPFQTFTYPGYLLIQLLGFVSYGVTVLLAFLDWRALKRRGVVRPFHWAWAFLGVLVYVIGRSVIVRRRVRGSLAPLWVLIGVTVLSLIVTSVVLGTAFNDFFSSVNFSELPSTSTS